MNKEIERDRLERHIETRRKMLGRHEEMRLAGDRAKDTGQLNKAKSIYEETVRRAEIASSDRFVTRTQLVVEGWVSKGMISRETADWLYDQFNLGYAGEARIETVAATSRLKLAAEEGKLEETRWSDRATKASEKHNRWWNTLERINKTLHGTPILWTVMIPIDRAVILQAMGEKEHAANRFEESFFQAKKILEETEDPELKIAAASDGGVARIRQARLMEEEKEKWGVDPEKITQIFKEGRDLVHWAGRRNRNYERSRVVEMWYTQHLWRTRKYKALIATLPEWIWLIRSHDGTRRMMKDYFKQVWQKGKEKFFGT